MSRQAENRRAPWLVVLALVVIATTPIVLDHWRPRQAERHPASVRLRLLVEQNLAVAARTDFGEPAQLAVWLEPIPAGMPRTVYVSHRSGTGDWLGKSECPDALPRWFAVWRTEHGVEEGLPTPRDSVPDAISRPTPHKPQFVIETDLPAGSRWRLWLEVNLSADYNDAFPAVDENGMDDLHANGQPSLLYTAEFDATPGTRLPLALVARTVPGSLSGETTPDLAGVTNARQILSEVRIDLR